MTNKEEFLNKEELDLDKALEELCAKNPQWKLKPKGYIIINDKKDDSTGKD